MKDKLMTNAIYNEIVNAVYDTLLESPQCDQEEFLMEEQSDLIAYNNNLGRHIRNKYKLWTYGWEPDIKDDGADHSPNHPDNLSQEIIEEVWRIGNE